MNIFKWDDMTSTIRNMSWTTYYMEEIVGTWAHITDETDAFTAMDLQLRNNSDNDSKFKYINIYCKEGI